MSKKQKLLAKLKAGSISARELRTLLGQLEWVIDRQVGSHEQWVGPNQQRLTLATHTKELMRYQIKEAQSKLL